MLHQQSLLQTRLHHNVKNLWLRGKNENKNSLSSGPIAAFKKIPFAPMQAVAVLLSRSPNKGSGKSGSCYWAGGWRVVKNKACQKSEKCKNPQAPSQVKKFIFSFFLQGNIHSISPEKMKIIFSEQGARPR